MTPKISVIMGIYNCASTLQEALDSLYAQTFQDFKIIMCDDGSKDETLRIAEENASRHNNIIIIKNEKNMGLNYTLNRCLQYADTEFCARMDGDDISLPTRFEKQIEFLNKHPEYAIVSSSMALFDEKGEFGVRYESGEPSVRSFLTSTPFCHAASMIRTNAYKDVGGYSVHRNLIRMEDLDLWLKLYTSGYKGYNIAEKLYSMRDNRDAIARRNWLTRKNEMIIRFRIVKELNLPVYNYIYVFRPLLLHLIPICLYRYLHQYKMKKMIDKGEVNGRK